MVRVPAGPHRRPTHAATAALRGCGHGHADPGRLDGWRDHGYARKLLGHLLLAHRLEAHARLPCVLLLPTSVWVLRAAVLLGGRDARLPGVHRRHDGRYIPVRRPTGRDHRQPHVSISAQAHANYRLGAGNVRVHVHCGRLPVRVQRRVRPAGHRLAHRAVPVLRILRHVRSAAVTVERVRRDIPNGRQGHHERRDVLVRIRAHVRRHQNVPDAGEHVRHPGRVDSVRVQLLHHLLVRRVRPARDYWKNAERDYRRVQVVQRQGPQEDSPASNTLDPTAAPQPVFKYYLSRS